MEFISESLEYCEYFGSDRNILVPKGERNFLCRSFVLRTNCSVYRSGCAVLLAAILLFVLFVFASNLRSACATEFAYLTQPFA
jgi:hypothetical protein